MLLCTTDESENVLSDSNALSDRTTMSSAGDNEYVSVMSKAMMVEGSFDILLV